MMQAPPPVELARKTRPPYHPVLLASALQNTSSLVSKLMIMCCMMELPAGL